MTSEVARFSFLYENGHYVLLRVLIGVSTCFLLSKTVLFLNGWLAYYFVLAYTYESAIMLGKPNSI